MITDALKGQLFSPCMDIAANGMQGVLNRLAEVLCSPSDSFRSKYGIGGELGILVDAPIGGGKTHLLKRLEKLHLDGMDIECMYYDLAEMKKESIQVVALLLNTMFTFTSTNQDSIRLLLWDNIDEIGDGIEPVDLLWSVLYESLAKCHMNGQARIFCISTCTSIDKVPSELTSVLRFGSSVSLLPPNMDERKNILTNLLTPFTIEESSDVDGEKVVLHNPIANNNDEEANGNVVSISAAGHDLLSFLASHTRGCSIGDITMLIRNEVQRQWLTSVSLNTNAIDGNLLILSYPIDAIALKECVLSYSSSATKAVTDTISYDISSTVKSRQHIGNNRNNDNGKSGSNNVPTNTNNNDALVGLESVQQKVLQLLQVTSSGSNSAPSYSSGTSLRACPGILLYGPSGCGKTALIEWIYSTLFNQYRMIHISCADLVQKVVGESEARLSRYFQVAHQMAPCILVLDNIDSAFGYSNDDNDNDKSGSSGSKRTANPALDRLLSSLLVEIDGMGNKGNNINTKGSSMGQFDNSSNVVVIATASSKHNINKALLRPGRIEEHILLDMPDEQNRRKLVESILSIKRDGMTLSTALSKTDNNTDNNTTLSEIEREQKKKEYRKNQEQKAFEWQRRVVEDVVVCTENFSYASVDAYVQQQLFMFMKEVLSNTATISEIRKVEGEKDVSYLMLLQYMLARSPSGELIKNRANSAYGFKL